MTIRPNDRVTFTRPHLRRGSVDIETCPAVVLSVDGDAALVEPLDRRLRPRKVKLEKLTKDRTNAPHRGRKQSNRERTSGATLTGGPYDRQ